MTNESPSTVEIFYSYSHKDEKLREELEKHLSALEAQGVIKGWHDRQITAGEERKKQIDQRLMTAQIILLMISADFLASDYCGDDEMKFAMKRHESREAVVIPVMLRSVDWKGMPFEKLQALPKGAKPVMEWDDLDQAFTNVAKGIRVVVDELIANPR
jgi:hypothetical protein